jgi:hypothetical protein
MCAAAPGDRGGILLRRPRRHPRSRPTCASRGRRFSFAFAAASFVAGLGWGWLSARQRSLVGVTVSHVLTGLFVLFVLFVLGSGVAGGTAGGAR